MLKVDDKVLYRGMGGKILKVYPNGFEGIYMPVALVSFKGIYPKPQTIDMADLMRVRK